MIQFLNKFFSLSCFSINLVAITGLLLFMTYSGIKGEQIYQNRLRQMADPALDRDNTFCLSFVKIEDVDGDYARAIDRRNNTFNLQIENSQVMIKGGTYSLTGSITSTGKFKVMEVQFHRYRNLKYIFSSLSFLIVIFLIIKYFRLNKKGIYLIRMNSQ